MCDLRLLGAGAICGLSTAALAQNIRVLPIQSSAFAYSAADGMFYATVSATSDLRRIDPVAGTVGQAAVFGSTPRHVVASGTGRFIYVGWGEEGQSSWITPFDTLNQVAGSAFSIQGPGCPRTILDLEMMPNQDQSVIVNMFCGSVCHHYCGAAVFMDGVAMPSVAIANCCGPTPLTWAGGRLWGYDRSGSPLPQERHGLWRFHVIPSGLEVDRAFFGLISGANPTIDIEGTGEAIYSTLGHKIDTDTVAVVGMFPFPAVWPIEPDLTNGRVWHVRSTAPYILSVYDDWTFGAIGSIPLPIPTTDAPVGLVRWGPDGIAVRTLQSIILINTDLVSGWGCYANCDHSTTAPILNVADFTCFLQRFAAGHDYANCDSSTLDPGLNVADFTCFLQAFASGCP